RRRTAASAPGNKPVRADRLPRRVTDCLGSRRAAASSMPHLSAVHAEPLRAELRAFVAAIRDGREPAVTGEEGVASLEIAIRCLEHRALASVSRRRAGPRRLTG